MEITGKIIQILPAGSGTSARGNWKRQDFILETLEQFPKKVCISNWNDKVDLDAIPKKATVTVSINIESREFNGKWYTDVKVWKIARGTSKSEVPEPQDTPPPPMEAPPEQEGFSDEDLPF